MLANPALDEIGARWNYLTWIFHTISALCDDNNVYAMTGTHCLAKEITKIKYACKYASKSGAG